MGFGSLAGPGVLKTPTKGLARGMAGGRARRSEACATAAAPAALSDVVSSFFEAAEGP